MERHRTRSPCFCCRIRDFGILVRHRKIPKIVHVHNKTDRHDIAEILFKVALSTIKRNQTKPYVLLIVTAAMLVSWAVLSD